MSRKMPPNMGSTVLGYEYTEYSKLYWVVDIIRSFSRVVSMGPGLSKQK